MAENDTQQSERTEQPTPKRLEDARKKGQVPRSRELSMTLVMLTAACFFMVMRPYLAEKLTEIMEQGLTLERGVMLDARVLPSMLGTGIVRGIEMLIPLWVVLFVAAAVGVVSFGGWTFSLEAAKPKLSKLNPLSGLKRVFGWNGLSELAKAMSKFVLVGVVASVFLWGMSRDFLGLGALTIEAGLAKSAWLVMVSFAGLSSVLILIAAVDVPFQAWQHKRRLRMTKQELKEEHKETEGKPEVRSKIRAAQQEIANRRMLEEVPHADVIAVNPTHFAVALKYDADRMKAPIVVAKGADLVALNIRRIGEAHNVPIFEHPPLTQALFYTTSLGEAIPQRLYVAVAQVLTYIYQLKRPGVDRHRAVKPSIEVDPELYESRYAARQASREGAKA